MIVIGVSDKGEVLGVDIGKKTIESLANKIKQSTDPMVYPSIRVEESDKKQVVAIEVEEGKQKPVLAFGRGFMRVGKTNQKLGYEEIRNLALERFSGNEPVKPYIDFQTLEGSAFDLVDRVEDFVLRNIKKSIWLVPGQVQREERYEYPPDAIREAITNAVVHRDYESSSKVQVRIFDNRIEVWSPGLLPEGITIDDLKREHRSIPRNPLLFKQFFWVKYVEDVGGGTLDMIKQCREWEIPEPEFKFVTGAFVVVFKLPPSVEDLEKLGLNKRQLRAVEYVTKKRFNNQ